MQNQRQRLLAALAKRPLTTGEIRRRLGIGMPATRVFELKGMGCRIDTEMVPVRTRYNGDTKIARYHLVRAPKRLVGRVA